MKNKISHMYHSSSRFIQYIKTYIHTKFHFFKHWWRLGSNNGAFE